MFKSQTLIHVFVHCAYVPISLTYFNIRTFYKTIRTEVVNYIIAWFHLVESYTDGHICPKQLFD